jgi:hypothetical protein
MKNSQSGLFSTSRPCPWANIFHGLPGAPPSQLMPITFCFGSVENTLQARRKQIPALKARNSKARGEIRVWTVLESAPQGRHSCCAALAGLNPHSALEPRVPEPAVACSSTLGSAAPRLRRWAVHFAADYPGSKKYAALAVPAAECRLWRHSRQKR